MTFLELCKEVHATCQIDGETVVSVDNQTGMNARVVSWVNRAYQDIQRHRNDWKFRQELAAVNVVAGQWQVSNLRDSLEHINPNSINLTENGIIKRMQYVDYDIFYDRYQSRIRTTGTPSTITLSPNWDIYINPIPTSDVTLNFWYTKTIDVLVENTDEPIIRKAHQDVILWKAVKYYAEEEEAAGVFQTAEMNYKTALNRMELDLRPPTSIRFTPLA